MTLVMALFDAAGATVQYLRLIDPAREAQAVAYTQGSHWLILWGWLVAVAVDVLVLRWGLLVGLRDRIQRDRPRPNLAAFTIVAVFTVITWIARLPWSIYGDWVRERSYGLSNLTFGTWLTQAMITTVVMAVLFGLVSIPIYALMRRTGSRWWAWSGLVVGLLALLAIVVAPVLVSGMLDEVRPAPAGPIRTTVQELARKAGIPSDRVVVTDGSKQTNRYTATVAGGPGFATIQLSDTMLEGEVDLTQIRAVVAHEIGHYVHNHLLILSAIVALLATSGLWLTDHVLRLSSLNRDRRTPLIQDPSALPLAHLVFSTFMLLTTPLIVSSERWIETDADAYGLQLANEPDGAAKALIRTVDFRASSPTPVEEALFYDHPSIANRVRRAMEWKRDHQPTKTGRPLE